MNLPKLKEAKFANNLITNPETLSVSRLPNLQLLDLSFNKLIELPMLSMFQLVTLNLNNNSLSNIGLLNQSRLPRMKSLNLASNQLRGNLPELYAPSLEEINLDKNDFSSIATLNNRQLLPTLKSASVANNSRLVPATERIFFEPELCPTFTKRPSDCANHHHFLTES